MAVLSRISNALTTSLSPFTHRPERALRSEWVEDPRHLYDVLRAYYLQLDLYEVLQAAMYEQRIWTPAMKPLYNPVHRAIDFHIDRLWPGRLSDIEVETENEAIVPAIDRIWRWSNWLSAKDVFAFYFSLYGDGFLKAVRERGKVRMQVIEPSYVTDFDKDAMGFVTYIRLDIPTARRNPDGSQTPITRTEVWDEGNGPDAVGRRRIWETEDRGTSGDPDDLDRLGTPLTDEPLTEFGIDFVPFVHAPFIDIGNTRGAGAVTHALDKIDEANRMATRLHQMLFTNEATWVVQANATDSQGRPLPPPKLNSGSDTSADNVMTLAGVKFASLPGNASMTPMVPDLPYAQHLAALHSLMDEIEQDLPELAYHRIKEMANPSGRAISLMMGDAHSKVFRARASGEQAIVRCQQMCLTLGARLAETPGASADIAPFAGIGTFDAGDFEHQFRERPLGRRAPEDDWDLKKAQAEWAITAQASGVSLQETLRERGYSEQEIDDMEAEREAEALEQASQQARAINRGGLG